MAKTFFKPLFQLSQDKSINYRTIWAANRFWMEMENMKSKRYGGKSHQHWYTLLFLMKSFTTFLHMTGQYKKGFDNAKEIALNRVDISHPNLPKEFHDFTILHLSDLHLDGIPGLEDIILKLLNKTEVDICVLTGDYRKELHGPIKHVMQCLKKLINDIKSHNGFLGVLGNHDGCHMVKPMEEMGIQMLINECFQLEKEGASIQFIGTDDVHYYYTDQALHALENTNSEFSIALVHSPELYDMAEEAGINLYLCGHTHGGQVCLPGGIPIVKHLNRGRRFYKGHWQYKKMHGITNVGSGASVPVRFNTRGEALIIKLKSSNIRDLG